MSKIYLLTGDIGGTNSRMGLYDTSAAIPLTIKFYRNEEHLVPEDKDTPISESKGLFERKIIAPFLQHCWESVNGLVPLEQATVIACLAIAGPVRNNAVKMSNLGNLEIDGTAIAKSLHCPNETYVARVQVCKVINDFVAQGYGCLTLKPNEVKELTPHSHKLVDSTGPKVCVGAGTGLGECYLTPNNADSATTSPSYTCFASEGGHTEFNPRSEIEIKLRSHLMNKFQQYHRISTERVVSGKGLANVYEFLALHHKDKVNADIHKEFLAAGDMQGKVVAVNTSKDELCLQAMQIMMSAYGSEVGCAGLKWIPTGGLFVTGGLTPKNIHHIEGKDSYFMKAYHDKGRVAPLLQTIPLFAVMVEDLGVRGAHKCCVMEYQQYCANKKNSNNITVESPVVVETKQEAATKSEGGISTPFLLLATLLGVTTGFMLAMKSK